MASTPTTAATPDAISARRTILIVEDKAIFREPIEAVLQRDGYGTACAADGTEAMALLGRSRPDLVLLDMGLPAVDGLGILNHIRSSSRLRDVPVLVLSAVSDRATILEAARLGVCGYMLKSQFSLKQMLDKIRAALEGNDAPSPGVASSPGAAPAPRSPAPEDPLEALKSLRPLLSRSEIAERVDRCAELRALSPTVAQITKMTSSAQCSIEAVAKVIAQDHAIALKILKLANSAVYTRGDPVDSVHKAVVRIGMERIRQAVLNTAVVDSFSARDSQPGSSHPDPAQFWEHSIACGLIAAEIAHSIDARQADAAFTMGLLHDLGRLIYAEQLGPEYAQVLETAGELALPLEQVESRMLLINHADIMDRVLHLWNFPKDLVNPIVHHHLSVGSVRSAAPHQVREVLWLGLANRLAHAMLLGTSGNETVYPTGDACAALGLDAAVIARIEEHTRAQVDEMKFAMLSRGSSGAWPQRRQQVRDGIGGPFRPLFVSAAPETDAYRILCNELRTNPDTDHDPDGPSHDRPNVAVVHLTHAREQVPVGNRLRLAEEEAGVRNLPLIVLSPAARLSLGEAAARGPGPDACQHLPTPVTVGRFIAAARRAVAGG